MYLTFSDCELNTEIHELRREGVLQHVEPQVFDLLVYLLLHAERTVSKDELYSAVWKGRLVSEATLSSRINAARRAIGDDGRRQALIKTVPRRGFRFVGEITARETSSETASASVPEANEAPPLPDKPSIAVLPFDNLSGDPEQAYFADGIADEIITALSHVEWLFVIARNSSFAFRGQALEAREIGQRLGVRYLLEGSVRRANERLRITARLVEAETSIQLWARRYEGGLEDVFELQDRIAESVLGATQPKLRVNETTLSRRKRPDSLDAYDFLLRAVPLLASNTQPNVEEAETYLHRALALDPRYGEALGYASWCRGIRPIYGWSTAVADDYRLALELAERAMETGTESADGLAYIAYVILLATRDHDAAIDLTSRALAINPSSFAALHFRAYVHAFSGDADRALTEFSRSLRLSPYTPTAYASEVGLAFAHNIAGRPDEALRHARKAQRVNPRYAPCYRQLVASLHMLGMEEEARQAASQLLALQANFTVSGWVSIAPLAMSAGQARVIEAMVAGGLPE